MLPINIFAGECSLLQEVLPFDKFNLKKSSPEDKLDAIKTILLQAFKALKAFSKKKMAKFDAAVGDELCEIRAYQMIILSRIVLAEEIQTAQEALLKTSEKVRELEEVLTKASNECEQKVSQIKSSKDSQEPNKNLQEAWKTSVEKIPKDDANYKALVGKINAEFKQKFVDLKKELEPIETAIKNIQQDYLNKCQTIVSNPTLDVKLSANMCAIIKAYLLTKTKKETVIKNDFKEFFIKDEMCVKALEVKAIKCPTAIFQEAIPFIKKSVIQQSVNFVEEEACKMTVAKPLLTGIFSGEKYKIKNGMEVLPFYYVLKTLYQRAFEERIPILFKVRNLFKIPSGPSYVCKALFTVEDEVSNPSYTVCKPTKDDFAIPALIVEAFSNQTNDNLKDPLFLEGLLKDTGGIINYLVEMDASQHTQYPGQKETVSMYDAIPGLPSMEKEKLIFLREVAFKKGYGKFNCSQCCVEHVYADLIGNQIECNDEDENIGGQNVFSKS